MVKHYTPTIQQQQWRKEREWFWKVQTSQGKLLQAFVQDGNFDAFVVSTFHVLLYISSVFGKWKIFPRKKPFFVHFNNKRKIESKSKSFKVLAKHKKEKEIALLLIFAFPPKQKEENFHQQLRIFSANCLWKPIFVFWSFRTYNKGVCNGIVDGGRRK